MTTDTAKAVMGRDDHFELKRNRQVAFTPAQVRTDGTGAITYRPLVRYPALPCFGLPHRYWRGEFDRPIRWVTSNSIIEKPHGCAGCRVRPACGKVAWERVQGSPRFMSLHLKWERETQRLQHDERYSHPTWTAFDQASRSQVWDDSHDAALAAEIKRRAEAERNRRAAKRKVKRRTRLVKQETLTMIAIEARRLERLLEVLAATTGAPRYVAAMPPQSFRRTADVWEASEMLKHARLPVTGKAIADQLASWGRADSTSMPGLTSRALEALRRLERLKEDGLWEPYAKSPPTPIASGGTSPLVVAIIEDDDSP